MMMRETAAAAAVAVPRLLLLAVGQARPLAAPSQHADAAGAAGGPLPLVGCYVGIGTKDYEALGQSHFVQVSASRHWGRATSFR